MVDNMVQGRLCYVSKHDFVLEDSMQGVRARARYSEMEYFLRYSPKDVVVLSEESKKEEEQVHIILCDPRDPVANVSMFWWHKGPYGGERKNYGALIFDWPFTKTGVMDAIRYEIVTCEDFGDSEMVEKLVAWHKRIKTTKHW